MNRTARILIIICFGFIVLTASLVEFAIAKPRMWQAHNAQLANFDVASSRGRATAATQQADVQIICLNRSEMKP